MKENSYFLISEVRTGLNFLLTVGSFRKLNLLRFHVIGSMNYNFVFTGKLFEKVKFTFMF